MGSASSIPELPYAGIPSFLKAPVTPPDELDANVDVGVVGLPFDGGASRRPGARFGPAGIRAATGTYAYYSDYKGGLVNVDTGQRVDYAGFTARDCGDAPLVPTDITRTRDTVADFVERVASRTFPVLLGGDHYLTYPGFLGVARALKADLGVIQLDAHTDTTAESPVHGKHYHGSPMARINETPHGGYDHHAMIGIRGYEAADVPDLAEHEGILLQTMADVRDRGITTCVDRAIEHATAGVDGVYVTVDIDVVDPAFAPGTGTPEPGGLTSHELLQAAARLGDCPEVVAVDLMEVAPDVDPTDATAQLGAKTIIQILERRFL